MKDYFECYVANKELSKGKQCCECFAMPKPKRASNTPLEDRRQLLLMPYLLLVSFHLYTVGPSMYDATSESLPAAVTKAAPIFYLACYVGLADRFEDNSLAQGARVGLVLSALGDICLVWRHNLFLLGMFFFALAQIAYMVGMSSWFRRKNYQKGEYVLEFTVACSLCLLFVVTGMDSVVMAVCVIMYTVLLFTMANLAFQRYVEEGTYAALSGALGGGLFVLSDFMIAVNKWRYPLPYADILVMLTYYSAQVAIAAGVVNTEVTRGKRRR